MIAFRVVAGVAGPDLLENTALSKKKGQEEMDAMIPNIQEGNPMKSTSIYWC